MMKLKYFTLALCLVIFSNAFSQKGKNGTYTVSAANTKINEFTSLTANATASSTLLNVSASSLNANARFTSTLTAGDLVMVIQMQGALIKLSATPVWAPDSTYGNIYSYQTCGNYEFAQVKSVISGTQIELECGLKYDYSSAGKTQVVRVPRYSSLNVIGSGVLTTDAWNGTIGGVLAAEVSGNSLIDGVITATGLGFRGGNNPVTGGSSTMLFSGLNPNLGGEKGEGIGSDRITGITHDSLGKYCMGAPGNGGGGGQKDNCGGGGGGNGGNTAVYNGYGVITIPGYTSIWDLEWPGRSSVVSNGGGKGGYGTSTSTVPSVNTTGPNNSAWGAGFNRVNRGGFGGRPMNYSTGKIFMGGGGGGGHMTVNGSGVKQSNGAGACAGGAGGGLVFLLNYGSISGSGTIVSNGANGGNAFGAANFTYPTPGIDGAGGAGAGGTIILQCNGPISGITANAIGGTGGSQVKSGATSQEAQGPGGGGGGGYIAGNGSVFTQNTSGGVSGTTNSTAFDTEFPTNGATSGSTGTNGQVITPAFSITAIANPTICTNQSTTLTATSTDASATILWYNAAAGGNSIASGTTYTTPVYVANGTYTVYAGSCPGIYRVPIIITVNTGATFAINSPTICSGQSTVLTVTTAATSYTWSAAGSPTTTAISVSPSSTTIYTINGGNGACVGSQTTQVVVNNTPTLTASSQTICAGQVATFTVSGGTTYTWNPGGVTGSTYTTSPASSGTVSVLGANGTCTSQITPSITVTPNPTVAVSNQTICATQTVILTASGATTYSWNTGPTTNTISVSPGSLTIYTVVGTTNLCSNTKTVSVTVASQPTVAVAGATICSGNSATLTANGATNYTWAPGGQLTTSVVVTPTTNTTYTITGATGTCTHSTTATVSVTSTPTLSTSSRTICAGQVATFTVSGAATYTWNPGGVTGNTYTTSPASSGTVSVLGANGSCTSQVTTSITVTPNPTVAVSNQTICPTQTVTLTASGATTYSWNTGPTTNTISVSPGSLIIYTVVGTTNLCSNTKTVSVTVASQPTVTVAGATICSGNSATLTANGATNYTWAPGGQLTTSVVVTPTTNTTYTITGATGTCTNSTTATVSVTSTPTLSTSSRTICAGQVATFTVSGAATYTWNPGGVTGNTYTTSPASSGTVSVLGANGTCTSQVTTSITVTPNPTIAVSNQTICPTQTVTLTASGATTYSWNTGSITNTISVSPSSTTIYTVIGTTSSCSNTQTVSVTVASQPTVTAASASICSGNSTILTANGTTNYTWMPGGQLTNTVSVSPGSTTVYTITGTDGTCTNTTTATVSVTATPTLVANSATICPAQTATLNVSGATTYTWNPGNVTGNTYTISPASDVTVSIIGANGTCTTAATVSVTIGTGISISVNNPTICLGQTASLIASGATSYTWNTGPNTNTLNVSPASTTTYTISGTNGACSGSNTAVVTVVSVPSVTVANDAICSGNTITLAASGATSYTWMPGGQLTSSITDNPSTTTIYTITGSNGICSNITTATVSVTATPTLVVNSTTICPGQTATLTANGATSYTWNPGGITGNTYTVSPASDMTVTIDGANGTCVSQTTASVTIGTGISITVNSPTICAGETATLTASGASTYTWNPGNLSGATVTIGTINTTTYTVVGTSGTCSGSNTVVVTVNSVPSVSVTSTSICSGSSGTLTASGAANYTWMPGGQLTSSITDNPTSTTIYTVTGANGICTNTATGTISVTATPTLAVNSATICAGQTATLIVSGATTYTWNPGSISGATITVTPTINTTYTVTAENSSCTNTITSDVTVTNCNNICSFNLGRDTAFCSPMNYTINGPSGFTSYSWTPGGATTQNITATNTGTYVCTGSVLSNDLVANGDFSLGNTMFASNYIVPVVPGPFGLLSNPGTYLITTNPSFGHTNFLNFGDHTTGSGNMMVCNGASAANDIVWTETITVSPNTNYNFSAWVASTENTSAASAAQLQFSINSTLIGAVYTAPLIGGVWGNFAVNWNSGASTSAVITIVDQNTAAGGNDFALDDIFYQQVCSYSDTIIVTENLTPTVTAIASNSIICIGNSTSLTANGASTYTWTGGVTNGTSFSPTVTATYSVIGTSVEGCTSSATQSVTVNALPTISLTPSTQSICTGQSATLTASGATTYTWSNTVNGGSQTVSPVLTTTYSVFGTDINGCVSTTAATSTVNVSVTPTISVVSASICAGQTATLMATGSATTYTWSTTQTTSSITTSPAFTTTYSVVGDNGGCLSTIITTTVAVTPSPTVTASSALLGGCAPFCTNFTDVVSSSATGIVYNFGDGNTSNTNDPNHCYTNGGSYTVTATVTNSVLGCSSTFTLPVIDVITRAVADFNIAEGNIVTVGSLVNFVNTSSNADSYLWNISCNGSSLTSQNFSATFLDTGICCINLVADQIVGCSDTTQKCINVVREAVVVIPNVFTPNGDNRNDVFKINSTGLKSLNCVIFDRWGLKMYEWDGLNGFWDGNAKSGAAAPDGTYFYIINYTDQLDKTTTEKGYLNLFND